MYLSEKKNVAIVAKFNSFTKIRLTVSSAHVPGLRPLWVHAYHFPNGRIKLVCFFDGLFLTGDTERVSYIATFDSVRSLYNVPGVHVFTDRRLVYAALGMNPYACK